MVIVRVVRRVIWNRISICNDGPYSGLHGYMHLTSWRVEMHGDVLEKFLKKVCHMLESAFLCSRFLAFLKYPSVVLEFSAPAS